MRTPRTALPTSVSSPGLAGRSSHHVLCCWARPCALAALPLLDAPLSRGMTSDNRGVKSLRLDAALFHDALPFVHFGDHEAAELGRGHLDDIGALGRELLLQLGRILHLGERLVQP